MLVIRDAVLSDLPALTALYNHYVVHTPITFDVVTLQPEQRRPWFDDHAPGGRHLLVAEEGGGSSARDSARWRPNPPATVESSVYVRHDAVGRGIGRLLYSTLFDLLAGEHVHTVVAGVALPNDASIALHERFGFQQVGVFREVGQKFDRFWDVAWFQRPMRT